MRLAGPGGWTEVPDREGPCEGPEGETPSGVDIGAGQSQPVTKACLTVKFKGKKNKHFPGPTIKSTKAELSLGS